MNEADIEAELAETEACIATAQAIVEDADRMPDERLDALLDMRYRRQMASRLRSRLAELRRAQEEATDG